MAVLESEGNIQELCLVSTAGIICIIGLMIHFFIVGVSVMDWWKGRPLTTADLLITSLGISRIIFQSASLVDIFWRTFYEKHSMAFNIAITILGNSVTYCNIWLSVLLSVFYSLKISNFQNVLILNLKKFISQRVLELIFMFVLLSIGSSTAGALASFVNAPKNSTQKVELDFIEIKNLTVFFYFLWNSVSFLFYVISSFAILGSLLPHMLRMKRNQTITSHLDAYYKTIRYTIVSLFCFALYLSISAFGMYYIHIFGLAGVYLIWNCFPMLHSIYLIYMAGRLRNHFFKIIHGMTKCLLFIRGSESASGVQMQIISQ